MPHRRRALAALIIAALAGTMLAVPASAAKTKPDKTAPPFAVTLNKSTVVDIGTEYLALTFTSTASKRSHGYARFELPTRLMPHSVFRLGFWNHVPQTTQPLEPGYFRIEATTCSDAVLHALSVGVSDNNVGYSVNPSIDVEFNCSPGQAFVIHWFVESSEYNLDDPFPDTWQLPVASRLNVDRAWTPQAAPTLTVKGHFITIPPLPWITPPVRVVDVEPVVAPEAPPQWSFLGDGIIQDQRVSSNVTIDELYRPDTGEPLFITSADATRTSTTIQVVGCLELPDHLMAVGLPPGTQLFAFDCAAMGNAIIIQNPNGDAFEDEDGGLYSSSAVIARVTSYTTYGNNWNPAHSECLFQGGVTFAVGDPLLSLLWSCGFPNTWTIERYTTAKTALNKAEFCPTGIINNLPTTIAQRYVNCMSM